MKSPRVPHLLILALLWAVLPLPAPSLSILLPTDRTVPPLALSRHEQSVVISDQVARMTIKQVFHNPTGRDLEAFFLFPIPKGAQVTDFSMIINGERVHGEVLESDKARGIYEDIVRRLRDPGLIEYMDDRLLRVRVFPVPARGDQAIDLELTQVLPKEGGLIRFEFPFAADPGRSGMPTERDAVSLSVEINARQPLATLYSPTHTLDVKKSKDARQATIRVDQKDLAAARDFLLYYGTTEKDIGANLVAYRPVRDEPGYFMLLLSPHVEEKESEIIPRDVVFVLDTSGSMAHDGKLEQAKEALVQCIGMLREADRFNLVVFSTDVDSLSAEFLPADAESRERAEKYIKKLVPRGGTNIEGALKQALNTESDKDRLRVIVFMTDGQPTVGQTVPKALVRDVQQRNAAGLRIFPFGIGYDVNAKLLDEIADVTRAAADYVKPKETIEQKVTVFFDKVSAPVLTNCELDIPGADVFDIYPQTLPDLFQGQQVMMFGRYRKAGPSAVVLEGKRRDKAGKFTYDTDFPESDDDNEFIEPLWGTRKIGFLLDQIRRNGESAELREEVVSLAKKYNVVTPYTSYLVTEDQPSPVPLVDARPGRMYRYQMSPEAALPFSGGETRSMAIGGRVANEAGSSLSSSPFGAAASPAPRKALALSMDSASGQAAVDQSIALRQMKESETLVHAASAASDTRRTVAGYTLVLKDGVWTDVKSLEETDLPTLKIQFGSSAYFELLKQRKDLKSVLQLGDRIRVRLEKALLEIGPEGVTELADAERALL